MNDWSIELLADHHERGDFDCGKPPLSNWLREKAGQFVRRDLCRVHVAVRQGTVRVLGYYSLSSHQVHFDDMPMELVKRFPRMAIPTVLVGKMAVDISVQGQGLGAYLLMSALRNIQHLANRIGIMAIVVHALDDDVREFYVKYGFRAMLDDPLHLFMPMSEVRKLGLPSAEVMDQ